MQGLSLTQDQIEQFLGPRGEHYHGGKGYAGCSSVCPVWSWYQRARALQIFLLDDRIETLQNLSNFVGQFPRQIGKTYFNKCVAESLDRIQAARAKFGN